MLKIDFLVASTSIPCFAAYSSSWVRVHFHSPHRCNHFEVGSEGLEGDVEANLVVPLPVQPWATATAP